MGTPLIEVLAMELELNGNPVIGSYVWGADPETVNVDDQTHLQISNKMLINVLASSNLQLINRSSGNGSGVFAPVATFLSGNTPNPVRTSLSIIKID
ncbi:hypothetical protein P4K49_30595 [Bacillus cereus]|uniref:hypothetical protein n=1 Tax=Bacillus thuringiensis TaxID=1428 RepID=UPI000676E88F|nr:hypothetical protein [Bacillus thuringiensis]MEB8879828.1 hypothetical protein [Bacillus cereus]AKR38945.1 Hypothetical protein NF53_p5192 [Bacillus thuringiensis serovar indiana]MEB9619170.1 hypothetical protein [Bacillus cereus]MEB9643652.1 hypothetical protein [Bacillus cereus]MEB9644175.1 hypothetical protein [Bacillus cereus]